MTDPIRSTAPSAAPFSDVELARIRGDFPILAQRIHGVPLVYLDNAASTQKPHAVIDAEAQFYARDYANVHRGVYELSQRATQAYEAARRAVAGFLGASDAREIVFGGGTTDAINLVASSFGRARVQPGDEILVTEMEHHSNIVPWQLVCAERDAELRVAPIDERGELIVEEFEKLLSPRTRIAAVAHVSNALGTVNPIRELAARCRERGVPLLVDGAQAVARMPVDVADLGCDFYAFSGHKLYGPTGIGALWARREWLEELPPYRSGGDMIERVSFERTTYAKPPAKFEAGTPNIAGAVGLAAAIDYVQTIGLPRIAAHEDALLAYAGERLAELPGLRVVGTAQERAGSISFVLGDIHAHDVGTILDRSGVAVRTGHHCAQPVMDHFGVPATARASFAVYNQREEIDALAAALGRVLEVFS